MPATNRKTGKKSSVSKKVSNIKVGNKNKVDSHKKTNAKVVPAKNKNDLKQNKQNIDDKKINNTKKNVLNNSVSNKKLVDKQIKDKKIDTKPFKNIKEPENDTNLVSKKTKKKSFFKFIRFAKKDKKENLLSDNANTKKNKNSSIKQSKNKKVDNKHSINKNSKNISKNNKNSIKNKKKKGVKSPLISNNYKKYLIIVAIICGVVILLEFSYFLYQKIVFDNSNTYYDSLNALVVDNSDIIAVGSSNFKYSKYNDYANGLEKAKLIKYDYSGKVIFEKMYDKGINTTFSSILNTDDGYIVVGSGEFSKEEQEAEGREAFIIKFDKDGNIVWEKYYQVVTNTRFNKVIATNDGYVAIGQSIYANMEMGNHTTGGGIIVKYDLDGNEIWCNNHGGMKSGNFNDIVEVNGDFYVVGKDATDSANLVKFNANGEYQWHKNYSYTDSIGFSGIAYLDNYLYVVGSKKVLPDGTGDDDDRNTTNTDGLFIKYDLDGKIVFEKTFGGSNYERYNSIIAHRDSLYVVGHTTSKDIGFKITTDGNLMTGLVVRYDTNGNINKKEIFGGSNNDNLTDVVTDGGSLYISGYSNSKDGNIATSKNNGKDYFGKVIQIDYRFRTKMVK